MRLYALPALTALAGAFFATARASENSLAQSSLQSPVGNYRAVFTAPPKRIPVIDAVDAPLLGNGSLLAALAGSAENLEFFLNMNSLWELKDSGGAPKPLGVVSLSMPSLKGASYRVEQELGRAVTVGVFEKDGVSLRMETGVTATENLLWVKLSVVGGEVAGTLDLSLPAQRSLPIDAGGRPAELGGEGKHRGFDGEMADVTVTDTVLSGKAPEKPEKVEMFDGKTPSRELKVPKLDRTMSVAAWIKPRHVDKGTFIVVSKKEWFKTYYCLEVVDGKLRWGVDGKTVTAIQPLAADEWVYVVGTYEGGNMKLFANGESLPFQSSVEESVRSVGDVQVVERRFENEVRTPTGAAFAGRVVGGSDQFTVAPGRPVLIVVAARSRFEDEGFAAAAVKRVEEFKAADLEAVEEAHVGWWNDFWSRSFVEIPDKLLEQRYYVSQYGLGSASRDPEFPPGLFGWITTEQPKWRGTYFLNYNFFAPFYGLYASNHIEQAEPASFPFIRVAERLKNEPRMITAGTSGIYQSRTLAPMGSFGPVGRVHAGPSGQSPEQKSNSAYACVLLSRQWKTTLDLEFAKRAYPYVQGVATFWENWLKYENGRYNDYDDAVHEESGPDMNPIQTLGLVRMVMDTALDMSEALGVDAERREKWQHIRDNLAPYPTCTVGDLPEQFRPADQSLWALPIFRYTEKGTAWWKDNTVGIQHIYPAGGIGLDSSPELLERARNQITFMNRWVDFNGMNSIYAAAARVGYDPNVILAEMHDMIEKIGGANGMIIGNAHGMEHFSIVPNAIQEMLMQSHEGVLRFFPCWPQNLDARFGTLRADGAFLVSAELNNGVVSGVKILSEKGRDCTVQNPWPVKAVSLIRDGKVSETVSGERFSFKTGINESVSLKPQ